MRQGLPRLFLAALLGAIAVAGFAPLEWFPLPLLSLAGLALLWQKAATPRTAAALGYAWGLGFFLAGVSWIYVSLHDVGGMVLPLAAAATLLFCAYLALFPALAGYGYGRLRTNRPLTDALLLAGLWCLTELLRGYLFTGFPWLALGYSQTPPSPLAGYAPVLGSYGVGMAAALIAALSAQALPPLIRGAGGVAGFPAFGVFGVGKNVKTQPPRPPLSGGSKAVACLALIILILSLGAGLRTLTWTQAVGQPFSVSLLQGNIPQSLKWDPQNLYLSIDSYTRLARDNPAQLVVLPETAIPLFFDQIPRDVLGQITGNGPVLIGSALRVGSGDDYSNSAVLLTPQAAGAFSASSYSKQHLVPFGEFIPPGFAGFLRLVNIPLAGFTAGPARQRPMDWHGQKLMPNICYEDLFGEEIRQALQGENAATVLINLSNTAWFGHSLAQPQHLQIARMRALETGRPMLRATNTGMTASIGADGTVEAQLPPFTQGTLTVTVQGRTGDTPFIRWGNLPALLLALAALMPALARRVMKSTKIAG